MTPSHLGQRIKDWTQWYWSFVEFLSLSLILSHHLERRYGVPDYLSYFLYEYHEGRNHFTEDLRSLLYLFWAEVSHVPLFTFGQKFPMFTLLYLRTKIAVRKIVNYIVSLNMEQGTLKSEFRRFFMLACCFLCVNSTGPPTNMIHLKWTLVTLAMTCTHD